MFHDSAKKGKNIFVSRSLKVLIAKKYSAKWLWFSPFFSMRQKALELWNLPQHGPGSPWKDLLLYDDIFLSFGI